MNKTPARQLVELKLGIDLDAYTSTRREQGQSWQSIADEIRDTTGVRISSVTLSNWHARAAA